MLETIKSIQWQTEYSTANYLQQGLLWNPWPSWSWGWAKPWIHQAFWNPSPNETRACHQFSQMVVSSRWKWLRKAWARLSYWGAFRQYCCSLTKKFSSRFRHRYFLRSIFLILFYLISQDSTLRIRSTPNDPGLALGHRRLYLLAVPGSDLSVPAATH